MSYTEDIQISGDITVFAWELQESFIRASGPGGQNVNKVASAVQLRWNVEASALPRAIKDRFRRKYGNRISDTGDIVIEAKEHRRQSDNRRAARERLKLMILAVARPPKRRRQTRPTHGSVRRRLAAKKRRGEIKALRGSVSSED